MFTRLLRIGLCVALPLIPLLTAGCAARTYPRVDDVQLALRVKSAILNDPVVGTQPVDVRASATTITLTGQVRSADDIDRLLAVARAVPGVSAVVSDLSVAPPGAPTVEPVIGSPPPERQRHLIGLGAAVRVTPVTATSLGTAIDVGPMLRLPVRNGLGPAIGFSWVDLPIDVSPAGTPALGLLRLRPLMFGLSWGRTLGRTAVSASAVGGWSFNDIRADTTAAGPFRAIHSTDSFVWRPGVAVWHDLDDRFGVNLFVGGLFASPRVTFASDDALTETRLATRTLIVSVGLAYWIF